MYPIDQVRFWYCTILVGLPQWCKDGQLEVILYEAHGDVALLHPNYILNKILFCHL
jgi:hypothetical protein